MILPGYSLSKGIKHITSNDSITTNMFYMIPCCATTSMVTLWLCLSRDVKIHMYIQLQHETIMF